MRFLKRIVNANFWYNLNQRLTIASTLRKRGNFDKSEISSIKRQYKKLYKGNVYRIKDVQSEYHVSWCAIVAAIYIESLKVSTKENALKRTRDIIFKNMNPESVAGYIAAAMDKAKDKFRYIVKSSKQQEEKFFGTTFVFSRPCDTSALYHLRVHKCLYNDFFREMGFPELMIIACEWDIVSWTKGIDEKRHKVAFTRPATLGLDSKECEFIFKKTE